MASSMPLLDHALLGKINLCFSFDDGEDGLGGFRAFVEGLPGRVGLLLVSQMELGSPHMCVLAAGSRTRLRVAFRIV